MAIKEESAETALKTVEAFRKRSPDALAMARCMAIVGKSKGLTRWVDDLKGFDILDEMGQRFTGVNAKVCMKTLESAGFVEMVDGSGRSVKYGWLAPLLSDWYAQDAADFSKAMEKALSLYEASISSSRWQYLSLVDGAMSRHSLLLAYIVSRRWKELESFVTWCTAREPVEEVLRTVVEYFPVKDLPFLSDDLKRTMEGLKAVYSIHWLTSPEALLEHWRDSSVDEMTHRTAGEIEILRGDLEAVRIVADSLEEKGTRVGLVGAATLRGALAFMRGEDTEAIAYFEKAMAVTLEGTRKRKAHPEGFATLFLLFAMLRRGEKSDLELFSQQLIWGNDLEEGYLSIYLNDLNAVSRMLKDENDPQRMARWGGDLVNSALSPQRGGLRALLNLLSVQWFAPDVLEERNQECVDLLREIVKEASIGGYLWIEKEASQLVAAIAVDTQVAQKAAKFVASLEAEMPPTITLTGLRKPPPVWEKSLEFLESYLSDKQNVANTNERRLLWGLENQSYYDSYFLSAFEQRVLKSGKWGKPRSVSLKILQNSYHSWDFLGPVDRRIASLVRESYEYRWTGGRGDYDIDITEALPLLAGHHHLYLIVDGALELSRPLTISEMMPTVALNGMPDGGVKIEISPFVPTADLGEMIFEEDQGDQIRFCRVSEAAIRLSKAFQSRQSRIIPAVARERVTAAVSRLSGDILVQGDETVMAESDVRKVDGDGIIRIRLTPLGEGLLARALVIPLGDRGGTFQPGQGNESVFGRDDEGSIRTVRDLSGEGDQIERLVAAYPDLVGFGDLTGAVWSLPGLAESLGLLIAIREMPESDRPVLEWPEGETLTLKSLADSSQFSLRLKSSTNWLEANGELQVDESSVLTMQSLLHLMKESGGSRFIRLEDGQYLALTEKLKRRLEDIEALFYQAGGDSEGFRLPEISGHLIEDFAAEASTTSNPAWKRRIKLLDEANKFRITVPETLQAELRPYQKEGFVWLSRLAHWTGGACLADDMGLGKTIQALAFLLQRAADGPALIVAPTSVAANWADETVRFAPTLNVRIFRGSGRESLLDGLGPRDVVILTYGLLQTEADAFASIEWNTVVIDEAQAIKNRETLRYKAAIRLKANFRLITTGTPVENHLDELYNLFHFIQPGLLGQPKKFREKFASPIEQKKDAQVRDRLRRLVNPFLLRRLKSEVLRDLPEKTEITLQVELSEEETAFYEALRRNAVENIESDADNKGAVKILAELMRLRRACCNPALIDKVNAPPSSKLAVFRETLGEILSSGHKVLVFSQFVDHLGLLRDHLEEEGIYYQYLDGATTPKQRKQRIDAFQAGAGDVFLISLKAGGFGLNLTAADYVIHMDPWWNPAVEDQASDRAHRIGQKRPVTIYRLVTTGTIEEKIVELHHQKRELAESLLTGTGSSGRITAKQLKALLVDS